MNDFEWVDYVPTDIYDGLQFRIEHDPTVFTMRFKSEEVVITWWLRDKRYSVEYMKKEVREFILDGLWMEI